MFTLKCLQKIKSELPHYVVIAVDNLQESIKAVKEAGGELIGEQMDIPGVGLYISFRDTEENVVGMLQPSRSEAMTR